MKRLVRTALHTLAAIALTAIVISGVAVTAHAGSTLYVNATYSAGNAGAHAFGQDAFATIGDAIAAASAGDTIEVAAGTYDEAFTVDKALTIAAADPANKPHITGTGTRATLAASDVTLQNLVFDLTGDTSTDGVIVIDRVGSWPTFSIGYSNVTLDGVEVLGGRRALYATVENMTIERSTFTDQYRDALFFNAVSGTTTIRDNTFSGGDANKAILFENFSPGDPVTSGAILIQDNTDTGKRNFVVYDQWQCSVLAGDGSCDATQNAPVTLTITGNHVAPYDTAVALYDVRVDGGTFDPTFFSKIGALTVTGNAFLTAGVAGLLAPPTELLQDDGVLIDARNNWWGAVGGVGTIAGATTTPWCTDSACATLSNNASLTALALSSGTLSPPFTPSRTAYTASVANGVASVTVTRATSPGASSTVTGGSSLAVGPNTVTVAVTSADGTATGAYTVTVTRAGAPPPEIPPIVIPPSTPTPAPTPSPTPTPAPTPSPAPTPHPITVPLVNTVTVIASASAPTSAATTSSQGTATVNVPAAALPEDTSVHVGAIEDVAALVQQAPPPTTASVAVGFQVNATAPDGAAVTSNFAAPVTLEFTVNAEAIPAGTPAGDLVVAFWNGTDWVEVSTTATLNPDGTFTLTATTDHFTVFVVLRTPFRGTFDRTLAVHGVAPAIWRGGPLATLLARAPGAQSVWVFRGGLAYGYVVEAPPDVNAPFEALFPTGVVSAGTIVFAVLP